MSECSCGLEQPFEMCCEPIINGQREAATPEALMRSRYSAYVHGKVEYLINSVHPETRKDHDLESIRSWAEGSQWHGLEIIATRNGGAEDETGEVEFIAHYSEKKTRHRHHELAEFRRDEGKWYFYDGGRVKPQQVVRETPKVGRNETCPCGSGKKYKKCCARQ